MRRLAVAVLLLGTVPTVAACGSARKADPSKSVLHTSMDTSIEEQQPGTLLDPANFYGGDGLAITMSAYDGLVAYKPSTSPTRIVPALAQSWSVSADGRTYTFKLRQGVKFASGNPMTSADVLWSFERFVSLKGGPSYMLDGVSGFAAPDPSTFVIKLEQPDSPLMDYLACPYGPKVLDSKVVRTHEVKRDKGAKYLRTHTAGTGPFQISNYVPDRTYVLSRNANYWGPKPPLQRIVITVMADSSNRAIALQNRTLDLSRVDNYTDYNQFAHRAGYKVFTAPTLFKQYIALNPNRPPFNSLAVRQALRAAIDRAHLVQTVWGPLATPSTELLPQGVLDSSQDPDPISSDPSALKRVVARLPAAGRQVQMNYNSFEPLDGRLAEALQHLLEDAGLHVKLHANSGGETWQKPVPPNIFVNTSNPDAASPDSWERLFYYRTGGLNFLGAGTKEIDGLIDTGRSSTDQAAADRAYSEAARKMYDLAEFITVADVKNAYVADSGFSDYDWDPAAPFSLQFRRARLG